MSDAHMRSRSPSVRDGTVINNPSGLTDMVAASSVDPPDIPVVSDDAHGLSLSSVTLDTPHSTAHPDQHWDGRRETLGSWFAEFETVLSTVSPELYEFAVEFYLSDRHKTVIFVQGQAAQLDGAMPRPNYTWTHPAPSEPHAYDVPHDVVTQAFHHMHADKRLRDATIAAEPPPDIPPGTAYPIDPNKYVLSVAQLHSWSMRLRNAILRFVSDLPVRHILAKDYPRDGRALLAHLRDLASTPLSTSQVNSVITEIQALVAAGIKEDTVASFREFGVIYHRLLARIPDANPSRDAPAVQAMRYIQAVTRNRPPVGQALINHFACHGVDRNDPAAVRDAIAVFLEDQATVQRLCHGGTPKAPAAPPTLPTLPDLAVLRTLLSQSLVSPSIMNQSTKTAAPSHAPQWNKDNPQHLPCKHCGGEHWNNDCQDERAGTSEYVRNKRMIRDGPMMQL